MTDFRASGHSVPIESVDQLVERFHAAGKPRASWRLGTEWEKLVVRRDTGAAASFAGAAGIERILRDLADRYAWDPQAEEGRVIALRRKGASITLEPGGQLELSGAPFVSLHETHEELATHVHELVTVTSPLDLAILGLGAQPLSRVDEIDWVPKARYAVMGPYMAKVGSLGQRMMKQTATVQANIDFSDEADAMRKLRVGQGIAPIVNGMFANSCLIDGDLSGYTSFRGHIWTDTDPARCGFLRFAFRNDASFRSYVEWALDVPLYFILRGGRYVTTASGVPFRRFLEDGFDGERATMDDWDLHLTTLFPEVRLKSVIEVRSADGQSPEMVLALPAFVKGVFYTPDCLDAAWDIVKKWSFDDVTTLADDVTRGGLRTRKGGLLVGEYAKELVAIADEGLRRQALVDASGRDERRYLEPLQVSVADLRAPVDRILEGWRGPWRQQMPKLVEALALH